MRYHGRLFYGTNVFTAVCNTLVDLHAYYIPDMFNLLTTCLPGMYYDSGSVLHRYLGTGNFDISCITIPMEKYV